MKIKWNKSAVKQLLDIIQYLEENDELEYAERLESRILSKIKSIPILINTFQQDRLKRENDGSFFAFEIDSYRISFRHLRDDIRILRIRHTSRRPYTR
ncbi:type II toxin-antitoxin system RelE/ParE family toxin [Pedobacter endophyticus]|uniref:Type II toxin-antitoxin system RelE/ParE family toxin n=1 Tax=Pedobacter endophyticus TaxID=2789740 RepID=A0A7S9L334_9SPHI|nr:type II toxin-antitoxin system RelE/ParE family toxin [Pedobacter endophyticus]QPH41581.1 type II toxin-antitoxin system RelE/ParE family toxin [Pedobacter endophyticus]